MFEILREARLRYPSIRFTVEDYAGEQPMLIHKGLGGGKVVLTAAQVLDMERLVAAGRLERLIPQRTQDREYRLVGGYGLQGLQE